MKKLFLKSFTALFLWSGTHYAQQMVVDLTTGLLTQPAPSYAFIPVGANDLNWKILKPGGGTYVGAIVNNGHDVGYLNWNQTFNSINPSARPISPGIFVGAPSDPFNFGDIKNAPGSQHIYRMQFNFDKTCNTITSAQLVIDLLTGDGITGMKLNGYNVSLPSYASSPSDYLEIMYAHGAPNNFNTPPYSQYPYTTTIPQKIINLNPADFANGNNNFFITVNPAQGITQTGVLMISAHIEINYTPVGSNNLLFNMAGSTSAICNGQPATINVGVNAANPSGYAIAVNNSYIGNGPSASTIVSPNVSTTYAITLSSPSGCVTQLNWPVTVMYPPVPNLSGSTALICMGQSNNAGISVGLNVSNPAMYQLEILDATNNTIIYPQGGVNISVPISPVTNTLYKIIITDLTTGCTRVTDWFVYIVYPPFCDSPFKVHSGVEIDKTNSNYARVTGKSLNPAEEQATPGFMSSWTIQELNPIDFSLVYSLTEDDCWHTEPGSDIVFPGFDAVNSNYSEEDIMFDCTASSFGKFLYGHTYWITRTVWSDEMEPVTEGHLITLDGPETNPNRMFQTGKNDNIKENILLNNKVSVSPNPSNGVFKIKTTLNTGTIEIMNLLGIKIKTIEVKNNISDYEIDLSGFSKGIYLMNINSNGQKVAKKIILE